MKIKNVALLFFFLAAFTSISNVNAQSGRAVVGFEPQTIEVVLDATKEIAITIKNVDELYAFDITIQYDPVYLDIVDANADQNGIQISQGTFLEGGMVIKNAVAIQSGAINYATTQLNPSPAHSGSGVLLVIRLHGKKEGHTSLSFSDVQLSTRDGRSIPNTENNAGVTISNTLPSGPPPTPFAVIEPQLQINPQTIVPNKAKSEPQEATQTGPVGATPANAYTPTVSVIPGAKGTQISTKSPDGLFKNWELFSAAAIIFELILIFVLVIILRKRKK